MQADIFQDYKRQGNYRFILSKLKKGKGIIFIQDKGKIMDFYLKAS